MDILCKIITNILHVVELLIMCSVYLRLSVKVEDRHRRFKVFMIIIIASLIDNAIKNPTIALSIYLLWIVIIVAIYYADNLRKDGRDQISCAEHVGDRKICFRGNRKFVGVIP